VVGTFLLFLASLLLLATLQLKVHAMLLLSTILLPMFLLPWVLIVSAFYGVIIVAFVAAFAGLTVVAGALGVAMVLPCCWCHNIMYDPK
jgi:hypothetical protein